MIKYEAAVSRLLFSKHSCNKKQIDNEKLEMKSSDLKEFLWIANDRRRE